MTVALPCRMRRCTIGCTCFRVKRLAKREQLVTCSGTLLESQGHNSLIRLSFVSHVRSTGISCRIRRCTNGCTCLKVADFRVKFSADFHLDSRLLPWGQAVDRLFPEGQGRTLNDLYVPCSLDRAPLPHPPLHHRVHLLRRETFSRFRAKRELTKKIYGPLS